MHLSGPLLGWFDQNARELPWRESTDPYAILVCEIMSHQTRIATVRRYYPEWMTKFPNFEALAAADEEDVLRVWEGMGYYRRARNLHACARYVVDELDGRMPTSAEKLRALPGVGAYTAAAVASIAYGECVPAVDGNVTRVVCRLFGIDTDTTRAATRRAIERHARELLDPSRPGQSNEAVMELGALVCKPRDPDCPQCPLAHRCEAFACGDPESLPVQKRAKPPRLQTTVVLRIHCGARTLIRRGAARLLGGLWEFPTHDVSIEVATNEWFSCADIEVVRAGSIEHVFTHIRMTYEVFDVSIAAHDDASLSVPGELRWTTSEERATLPMSVAMRRIAAITCDRGDRVTNSV